MGDLGILKSAGVIEILLYLKDYPCGRRKVDIRKDLGLNPATAIKARKNTRDIIHAIQCRYL
ncbi:MAG: hypothetical protein ACTSYS_12195, partial [Promethearchaeota archaeon]